jgi:hypothetical protein
VARIPSALSEPVLKDDWDAKQSGDKVMGGMIKVSAAQAIGAHDADLALVGERAYVVEHDNDVKPGHGAGNAQYCVLNVVNLRSMTGERVIPMAKSAEAGGIESGDACKNGMTPLSFVYRPFY